MSFIIAFAMIAIIKNIVEITFGTTTMEMTRDKNMVNLIAQSHNHKWYK
jgi:hypothetical protein